MTRVDSQLYLTIILSHLHRHKPIDTESISQSFMLNGTQLIPLASVLTQIMGTSTICLRPCAPREVASNKLN